MQEKSCVLRASDAPAAGARVALDVSARRPSRADRPAAAATALARRNRPAGGAVLAPSPPPWRRLRRTGLGLTSRRRATRCRPAARPGSAGDPAGVRTPGHSARHRPHAGRRARSRRLSPRSGAAVERDRAPPPDASRRRPRRPAAGRNADVSALTAGAPVSPPPRTRQPPSQPRHAPAARAAGRRRAAGAGVPGAEAGTRAATAPRAGRAAAARGR